MAAIAFGSGALQDGPATSTGYHPSPSACQPAGAAASPAPVGPLAPFPDEPVRTWTTIDQLPAGGVPYAKGAGSYRAPGTGELCRQARHAMAMAAPAKTAAAAQTLSAPSPKTSSPLSLDLLLRQWRLADRRSGHSTVYLGLLAYRWLKAAVDRPAALAELKTRLAADGFRGERLKIHRYIGCYWVGRLFSADQKIGQAGQEHPAEMVGTSILRTLIPLCRRDPRTEKWTIRAQCHDEALLLWGRILAGRPTIAAVAAEVARIRPPHIAASKTPPKSLKKLLRVLSRLGEPEAAQALAVLEQ